MRIKEIINQEIKKLYEVRHIKTHTFGQSYDSDINDKTPLFDNETIIVYHGFNDFEDGLLTAKFGLSGKERAKRIYSYETGNNPKGLFVTIEFFQAKKFAHGGVIVEFATKVANLEAPVWVGGRGYFGQGEYTKSFKNDDERQQQQLANREKHKKNEYSAITDSDRPELAYQLYEGSEKQALFIGDLNPNMIKAFWVNDVLKDERRTNGQWIRIGRNEFLKKYDNNANLLHKYVNQDKETYSDNHYDKKSKIFQPADDFNLDKLKDYLKKHRYKYDDFIESYIKNWDNHLMNHLFYPKQIEQIKQYYDIK